MATYFWVGGNGTWDGSSTSNWSASSGGAGGAGVPTAADTVNFTSASGTGTCTTAAGAVAATVVLNSSTCVLKLGADLVISGQFTLTLGVLNLDTYTLSCSIFDSFNTNVRSVAFGTGAINVTGNAANIWNIPTATNFSFTGTSKVNLTYSGSTGTRTIRHGYSSGGTEANAVSVYVTAGTDTVIFPNDGNSFIRTLNFTGFGGTWAIGFNNNLYGDLVVSSGMTISASTRSLTFAVTSGVQQITSNGKTLDFQLVFNGAGSTFELQDALTQGSTRTTTLTNGTLNANNKNVTIGSFALGAGTKTLTLGSGTWTVAASGTSWNANTNVANLTVSASTGTISMTSASAKTFAGGGKTWPTLNQGGAGTLTIQQANTFTNITNTVQPATITFPASTTTTVSAFSVSGTSGNQITLNSSTPGTRATLFDATGVVSVSFCTIQDIDAAGGAVWNAYVANGNVDGGNNVDWDFGGVPATVTEVTYRIRSFTETRRF